MSYVRAQLGDQQWNSGHRPAGPGPGSAHPWAGPRHRPELSHKAKAVRLYLWGLQFTEIVRRTGHAEGSIRRYLADFRQIAALYARGASVPEIRAATGRSAALIGGYIGLYERATGSPGRACVRKRPPPDMPSLLGSHPLVACSKVSGLR